MDHICQHADTGIQFEYTYSRRRKTLCIRVEPPDRVRVLAPYRTSLQTIMAFVHQNSVWIMTKLGEMAERYGDLEPLEFRSGESLLFLGRSYPLLVISDATQAASEVYLLQDRIEVQLAQRATSLGKPAVIKWYLDQAGEYIESRVNTFRDIMKVEPHRVSIRDQKTRWGSCSAAGNLNFNWRLVLIPPPVIDYVVVHEMCHLLQPDHSRHFWQQVALVLPDYVHRRIWLQAEGPRIMMQYSTRIQ